MVKHSCDKYGMTISKQENPVALTRSHVKKPYKFDVEVKGQRCIRIMNIRDTSFQSDTPMCKNMICQCQGKLRVRHEIMFLKKNYKFDLSVKDKGHTGVEDVHNTLFHGETTMCQIRYAKYQSKKKLWDEPAPKKGTDRVIIPIHLPEFRSRAV